MKMEYKFNPKTWEDSEEMKAGYHTCECCGKQSSYTGRQFWYNGHKKRGMVKCRSLAWTRKCHTILKLLFTKSRKWFIIKL